MILLINNMKQNDNVVCEEQNTLSNGWISMQPEPDVETWPPVALCKVNNYTPTVQAYILAYLIEFLNEQCSTYLHKSYIVRVQITVKNKRAIRSYGV